MKRQETINYYRTLSNDSLAFIINDAWLVARLDRDFNPNVGKYIAKIRYATAELSRRTNEGRTN